MSRRTVALRVAAIILGISILSGPLPVRAEEVQNPDEIAKLDALRLGLVKAFEARDIDAMLKYTRPDVRVTWQNGEVSRGQDKLKEFFQRMMVGPNSVVVKVTGNPVVEERKIYGDHVISIGHMNDEFTLRGDGTPLKFDSRFSALAVKENDQYLIAGLHLSVNAFDNPVSGAIMSKVERFGLAFFAVGFAMGAALIALFKRRRPAVA